MDTLYRTAVPGDAKALASLNALFNGEGCQTTDGARAALGKESAETVFVAECAGVLVGFLCGQLLSSFCYARPTVVFTELYVVKEARRKGVAGGLMAFAERWYAARGAQGFQLQSGADNLVARAFYARSGYREDGEISYAKDAD